MPLFGTPGTAPLPPEYLTSHRAWDEYMAQVWLSLLPFIALPRDAAVVEIAPGASAKIALALGRMNFCGDVYIVEPAPPVMARALENYRRHVPQARIRALEETLQEAQKALPHKAFWLANHPLDDMLLSAGASAAERAELFKWTAEDDQVFYPVSQRCWQRLAAEPPRLEAIKNAVCREWVDAIAAAAPAGVVISQYNSSALAQNNLADLNRAARDIAAMLAQHFNPRVRAPSALQPVLNQHLHYNNAHIGGEILNAANWLILGE